MHRLEQLGLRTRMALFFVLIGAVSTGLLTIAIVWLSVRLGPGATGHLVLIIGSSAFAIAGMVAWVALKFDENLAKPLTTIASDLKAVAHADGKSDKLSDGGQYLGMIAPAALEVSQALAEERQRTQAAISAATNEAARQKGELEALLRDLHYGLVICTLSGRVTLYNHRALDLLHVPEYRRDDPATTDTMVGSLGLGRNLFNIVDEAPIRAVIDDLQADDCAVSAHPIAFSTHDGQATMNGRIALRTEDDGNTPVGFIIIFDDLSAAPPARTPAEPIAARPEFYDFDLFERETQDDLLQTPLSKLHCVVFDCEMTGLDPRRGDEIVSIAGARIVNGRVLTGEVFDLLVNPGRPIPPASTDIHHITDQMVARAPKVGTALKRFHTFAHDQVLVAHNAAFDMAFLAKDQETAGVRFDNVVLDTVLLAAWLQGANSILTLDALADRFNVPICETDRHTARGDALATAHVFVKLIRLLEAGGVVTLGDALRVSEDQTAIRRRQRAYA